ncbi:MAG: filamentation induced By protein Fic [bacterium]|nr:filamentation induced By protein Fic [bacterium]
MARLDAWLRYAVVYHCNALEGGGLTETETRAVLVDGLTVGKPLRDHLWTVNLSVAVERVDDWSQQSAPITEAQILALNGILLRGIDELGAGAYRKVAVYLTGAPFEPPPPEAVASLMGELSAWLGEAGDAEPIVFAAEMHAWFETIHPFVDGNGRAGRLLVDLWLQKCGLIRALIRVEERDRYRDALERAQSAGELTPLVRLFSDSVGKMLAEHERASQPR